MTIIELIEILEKLSPTVVVKLDTDGSSISELNRVLITRINSFGEVILEA